MARRSISAPRVERQRGFALIEIVAVLAIVALLAAITLPALPRTTSRARLEGFAVAAATLLKADRAAALRRRARVVTQIDTLTRTLRSGASGRSVVLPGDVALDALLAARCDGEAAGQTIVFFATGTSCGGVLTLARPGMSFEVRVNWLTGGVEIAAQKKI